MKEPNIDLFMDVSGIDELKSLLEKHRELVEELDKNLLEIDMLKMKISVHMKQSSNSLSETEETL